MSIKQVEYIAGCFEYTLPTDYQRYIEIFVHPKYVNIYLRDSYYNNYMRAKIRLDNPTARGLAIEACLGKGTLPILADWCDENGVEEIFGKWMRICVDSK